MPHATVGNTGTNEASRALYEACSFEPWHLIDRRAKIRYVSPDSLEWSSPPGQDLTSCICSHSRAVSLGEA